MIFFSAIVKPLNNSSAIFESLMSEHSANPSESNLPQKQANANLAKHPQNKHGFFESVVQVGENIANQGKAFVEETIKISSASAKPLLQWMEERTRETGKILTAIGDIPLFKNPIVQRFAGVLRLEWLLGLTNQVDLAKAKAEVERLQKKYPHEPPREIAHRLMVKKAVAASGIGFASSILPGFATALLALDLAANITLQTEMVYEIAAAYGLNLTDTARKGEVVAIFGLALGGSNAIRAGLGFMRNIPLAGAMIGAGTNATMLYSLGYAACRFYEAKLQSDTNELTTEALSALQQENEEYLDFAIAQQAVMDNILVHMIIASYPEKTWSDILPDIKALNLEPSSLDVLAANIKTPQPLNTLLNQLNRDFAIPLLAQCQRIAQLDGSVSPEEAKILQAIAEKFEIAL